MQKRQIYEGASEDFLQDNLKIFKNGLPKTYRDFVDTIKKWEGIPLMVEREYGERIVLSYPEVQLGNVVAIDIEKKYTE